MEILPVIPLFNAGLFFTSNPTQNPTQSLIFALEHVARTNRKNTSENKFQMYIHNKLVRAI